MSFENIQPQYDFKKERTIVEKLDPREDPSDGETAGQKIYQLAKRGFFSTTSIDEDAFKKTLSNYLKTGDTEEALDFFDKNYDPNVTADGLGTNGREAFREALEKMNIVVPDELENKKQHIN